MANKALEIKLEREGFPIVIGEVEFFFGTSIEDLQRFFSVQEELERSLAKIGENQNEISEESTAADVQQSIDFVTEKVRLQYDALLGEGSFEKIYSVFPYVDVLAEQYDVIAFSIADRIEKETEKRKDRFNKKKAELLKNKARKKKK